MQHRNLTVFARKLFLTSLLLSSLPALAQQDMSNVEIIPHQLSDSFYYLEGQGGNIGVSIGEDGVLLVDDQYAPLSKKILDAIAELTDQPLRFVINTHIHGDHVGGNTNMAKAGATIFAHENVRDRLAASYTNAESNQLSGDQRLSLPLVTFPETIDFHLNGQDIHVFHLGPGHTDGDSFVYFKQANIIHTGDVFRTTAYPRIDANTSGSFHGIVKAYEMLLDISNSETKFLPGHGVVSSQQELRDQLGMFNTIRTRVRTSIAKGMSLSQIQASELTAEYDERWGDGDALVAVIYGELLRMH